MGPNPRSLTATCENLIRRCVKSIHLHYAVCQSALQYTKDTKARSKTPAKVKRTLESSSHRLWASRTSRKPVPYHPSHHITHIQEGRQRPSTSPPTQAKIRRRHHHSHSLTIRQSTNGTTRYSHTTRHHSTTHHGQHKPQTPRSRHS